MANDSPGAKRLVAIKAQVLAANLRHLAELMEAVGANESKRKARQTWHAHAEELRGAAGLLDEWVCAIHQEIGP